MHFQRKYIKILFPHLIWTMKCFY